MGAVQEQPLRINRFEEGVHSQGRLDGLKNDRRDSSIDIFQVEFFVVGSYTSFTKAIRSTETKVSQPATDRINGRIINVVVDRLNPN